jgi:hypothetical protein
MKAQILIVKSNDSKQINRIKNLFEAKGHQVAVMEESDMELVNDEFAALPINQKFPHVSKLIGNMQKKKQKQ